MAWRNRWDRKREIEAREEKCKVMLSGNNLLWDIWFSNVLKCRFFTSLSYNSLISLLSPCFYLCPLKSLWVGFEKFSLWCPLVVVLKRYYNLKDKKISIPLTEGIFIFTDPTLRHWNEWDESTKPYRLHTFHQEYLISKKNEGELRIIWKVL